jgi:archaeal type IV pilus assembly protein PilA
MKTTTLKPKELKTSHRAVAPVIATLLMVAIAVVGGTIIFVFSQGFFSSSQISGAPNIEAAKILGYDARAADTLQAHDGVDLTSVMGNTDSIKQADERILIYLTNDSVQKIVIGELSFGGYIYEYRNLATAGLGTWNEANPANGLTPGNFTVVTDTTPETLLDEGAGELKAGETATIVVDLESDLRIGRGTQFKLTTSNGNVFVGTVNVGQQSG